MPPCLHHHLDAHAKTPPQVVTKGKAKVPVRMDSGNIIELGNFCCEIDQEVPLEDFK